MIAKRAETYKVPFLVVYSFLKCGLLDIFFSLPWKA